MTMKRLMTMAVVTALGLATIHSQDAKPLYQNNFEQAAIDQVPDGFLVLDGGFVVKEEGGNKFLELPGAPLDTFGVLFGPSEGINVAVSARQQKAVYVSDGPLHLRIERTGAELRLSHSPDGLQWSSLPTVTDLPMGQRVLVGVAAVDDEDSDLFRLLALLSTWGAILGCMRQGMEEEEELGLTAVAVRKLSERRKPALDMNP